MVLEASHQPETKSIQFICCQFLGGLFGGSSSNTIILGLLTRLAIFAILLHD